MTRLPASPNRSSPSPGRAAVSSAACSSFQRSRPRNAVGRSFKRARDARRGGRDGRRGGSRRAAGAGEPGRSAAAQQPPPPRTPRRAARRPRPPPSRSGVTVSVCPRPSIVTTATAPLPSTTTTRSSCANAARSAPWRPEQHRRRLSHDRQAPTGVARREGRSPGGAGRGRSGSSGSTRTHLNDGGAHRAAELLRWECDPRAPAPGASSPARWAARRGGERLGVQVVEGEAPGRAQVSERPDILEPAPEGRPARVRPPAHDPADARQ